MIITYYIKQKKEINYSLNFNMVRKKPTFNLIDSSKNFNFNCSDVNLQGAYGLSNENQRLFHQKGSIGKPSNISVKPQSKIAILQILKLNSASKSFVKIKAYSLAASKIPITYENWVISMMRKPSGKDPEHVFLIIEGVDQLGKGVLGRIDLVNNREKDGYARIIDKCLHDISLSDLKSVFLRDLLEYHEVYSKSWSLPRNKVLLILEDVEKDKLKEIKYSILGNSSVFVKSSSTDDHNCFTWLREKLFNLEENYGDDEEKKIQKELKEKWTDSIAAKPSFYLPANKKEQT